MDISLNQDSLLAENDLNTDVEKQTEDTSDNMEEMDELSVTADSGAVSMEETNGEVTNIKVQNMIKKALMGNEKKMEAYKEEMNKEIKALRTQIQNQTLKMDDMKLRLEMIGIHVPADVTNVSLPCEFPIKKDKDDPIFDAVETLRPQTIFLFFPRFLLQKLLYKAEFDYNAMDTDEVGYSAFRFNFFLHILFFSNMKNLLIQYDELGKFSQA